MKTILLASLILPLTVLAGKDVGNGADSIICKTPDGVETVQLFDYYEAQQRQEHLTESKKNRQTRSSSPIRARLIDFLSVSLWIRSAFTRKDERSKENILETKAQNTVAGVFETALATRSVLGRDKIFSFRVGRPLLVIEQCMCHAIAGACCFLGKPPRSVRSRVLLVCSTTSFL